MFRRLTPASRSGPASFGSRVPFVVTQTSRMPSTAAASAHRSTMLDLTSGSPPVMRSLLMPREAAARMAEMVSSWVSISSCRFLQMPSSGMQ